MKAGQGTITRPTRAMQLIEKIIRDGVMDEEQLARTLVVTPRTLIAFRSGKLPIPADRQLCLALASMDLPPKYARLGVQLRNQVRAAADFAQRVTKAHASPRVSFRQY